MSSTVNHVVVFIPENHTTDNYFRSMAPRGANVATGWPTATNPPAKDQPHDRHAYARWLAAKQAGTATPAFHAQFDTTAVLPFYAYLAATGAFPENHCSGFGTNSTPNHLLIVGGQSPTLRNPPGSAPQPGGVQSAATGLRHRDQPTPTPDAQPDAGTAAAAADRALPARRPDRVARRHHSPAAQRPTHHGPQTPGRPTQGVHTTSVRLIAVMHASAALSTVSNRAHVRWSPGGRSCNVIAADRGGWP